MAWYKFKGINYMNTIYDLILFTTFVDIKLLIYLQFTIYNLFTICVVEFIAE